MRTSHLRLWRGSAPSKTDIYSAVLLNERERLEVHHPVDGEAGRDLMSDDQIPPLASAGVDGAHHGRDRFGIERGERLVEEQERSRQQQRSRQRQAVTLALAEV